MKRILYVLIAISSLTLLTGCGDFLNNPPKGMTIPSNADDYQKLLANSSLMSALSSDNEYLTDNVQLFNIDASATRYVFVNKSESIQRLYSFAPGDISAPGSSDYQWNRAYDRIFVWNTVINNVMDSEGSTDQHKRALKAEALFGRAYDYFMLVNTYGKHYNKATASTDYGVPLVLVDDINHKITKRESVQEVYDQIFADLQEAENDIPAQVAFKNHPDQCALLAFYAKIYLFMGNYPKALEYADKSLKINDDMLDLNDYIMKTGSTWDRVVLKADNTQRFPDIDHPEYLYVRWLSGGLQGEVALSPSLRDLFKKDIQYDTTDLRKYYFTSEDMVDFGGTPDYFKGECVYAFYSNVNAGLSTVETKLIAAECEARVGDYTKAINHINDIRSKRFNNELSTADYYVSASNKQEALEKVLDERRREMMMKSQRLFDLKRLNMDAETAMTVTHTVDGQTWTITPNSNLYIFPINNVIMGYNPGMPQYDRK